MSKKSLYIIISVLGLSLLVSFLDAVIKPAYYIKIPIKILFFLAFPIIFFAIKKQEFKNFKELFKFKKESLLKPLLFGLFVYLVIVGGYFLTRDIIDYSNVTANLDESMGITANNFVYVFLYISFMNSFLEEFFFRGFGFITLKKYTNRRFAYIFSSSVFAIYHVGMLLGSFHVSALVLILVGLIIGGCIFNYLNEVNDNIYPSWFVHMFANFAINTIGFILFGIL